MDWADCLYVGLSVLFFGLTWAFLYVVGGIVSLGLLIYLVLALLKPELFA